MWGVMCEELEDDRFNQGSADIVLGGGMNRQKVKRRVPGDLEFDMAREALIVVMGLFCCVGGKPRGNDDCGAMILAVVGALMHVPTCCVGRKTVNQRQMEFVVYFGGKNDVYSLFKQAEDFCRVRLLLKIGGCHNEVIVAYLDGRWFTSFANFVSGESRELDRSLPLVRAVAPVIGIACVSISPYGSERERREKGYFGSS